LFLKNHPVLHPGFLKRLLGAKKGTNFNCVLRKKKLIYSIGSDASYVWNSLPSSNNLLLKKVLQADFFL